MTPTINWHTIGHYTSTFKVEILVFDTSIMFIGSLKRRERVTVGCLGYINGRITHRKFELDHKQLLACCDELEPYKVFTVEFTHYERKHNHNKELCTGTEYFRVTTRKSIVHLETETTPSSKRSTTTIIKVNKTNNNFNNAINNKSIIIKPDIEIHGAKIIEGIQTIVPPRKEREFLEKWWPILLILLCIIVSSFSAAIIIILVEYGNPPVNVIRPPSPQYTLTNSSPFDRSVFSLNTYLNESLRQEVYTTLV